MASTRKTSDAFVGVTGDSAVYTNPVDKPYPFPKGKDEAKAPEPKPKEDEPKDPESKPAGSKSSK